MNLLNTHIYHTYAKYVYIIAQKDQRINNIERISHHVQNIQYSSRVNKQRGGHVVKIKCYTYTRPESFLISLTIRRKYYLLLLRLLLFLLNLVVFPFSADIHILTVLVADRSTLAAKHLARPQPDRWPRILVPGRWIDVPTKIDFRSGQRALPLLEIAESGRDCCQFVAIRIRYRFRGLYAAR